MKANLRLIGGKRLQSPKNIYTRPTTLRVREAIFNILKNKVENSNWLDLFSGTGAISCEAYNHGARKIIAIEKNKIKSKFIQFYNFRSCFSLVIWFCPIQNVFTNNLDIIFPIVYILQRKYVF